MTRMPEGIPQQNLIEKVRLEGGQYVKKTLTRARRLSAEEVKERGGIVVSTENKATKIEPGDYLALDAGGKEYRIRAVTLDDPKRYKQVGTDPDGFDLYQSLEVLRALQINEPFTAVAGYGDVLEGKAGDYLVVREDGSAPRVVSQEEFIRSYKPLAKKGDEN